MIRHLSSELKISLELVLARLSCEKTCTQNFVLISSPFAEPKFCLFKPNQKFLPIQQRAICGKFQPGPFLASLGLPLMVSLGQASQCIHCWLCLLLLQEQRDSHAATEKRVSSQAQGCYQHLNAQHIPVGQGFIAPETCYELSIKCAIFCAAWRGALIRARDNTLYADRLVIMCLLEAL